MKTIFSLLVLIKITSCAILSTVNFATYSSCSDYGASPNPLGLSMDFPTIFPYFSNELFQQYLLNSNINGNWYANF